MTMIPREAFDAVYMETVPIRITPARHDACHDGPTARWMALEAKRELRRQLWALAAEAEVVVDAEGAA